MTEKTKKPDENNAIAMDFSAFILSLNASSLIHLGEIPDPQSRERTVNVPAAKHTIEILEILLDKTKGNLDEEEGNLLNDIIYNLRMKYLQHTKS